MPPGGLPEAFLDAGERPLTSIVAALRARPRPVHDRRGERALRHRRRAGAARARARGSSRPRRAPARRHRARVVRPRGPAPAPARLARGAAEGGRADGAARARTIPPRLARHRPPRDPARGARPAAGAGAPGVAVGDGRPAAARPRLPPDRPRRAVRLGRGRVGRRRPRPGRAVLPRGRFRARQAGGGARARGTRRTTRSAPRSGGAPSSGTTCSRSAELDPEVALPALWELVWAGEVTNDAWTPLRAARRYGVPQAERRRSRRFDRRRASGITATQGRWTLADRLFAAMAQSHKVRIAGRSRSSCSSVRGSSLATPSARRGSPAATEPSTAS